MSSTVGAPEDEYVSVAERLMLSLSKATDRQACARILEEYDMRTDALVDEVWRVFSERQPKE